MGQNWLKRAQKHMRRQSISICFIALKVYNFVQSLKQKLPPGLFQLVLIPKQLQQGFSCFGLHVTTAESNHLNNFQQG